MASSIVHLAVTNEIIASLDFNNTDRLKFGAVVVDSGYGGNSHLKIHILDGQKKTYDFNRFRQLFGECMLVDDLYLGYYLHLVQDALFRQFVYNKYHWNPTIPGNVERLHKDYSIVNYYVVTKYHLHNDLVVPDGFEHEAINQICSFDTEGLLMSMDSYFLPVEEEPIFFFTKEMSDEFIEGAIDFCVQEIEKIRRGEAGIDMVAYAWNRSGLPVDESPKYDSVSISEVITPTRYSV